MRDGDDRRGVGGAREVPERRARARLKLAAMALGGASGKENGEEKAHRGVEEMKERGSRLKGEPRAEGGSGVGGRRLLGGAAEAAGLHWPRWRRGGVHGKMEGRSLKMEKAFLPH